MNGTPMKILIADDRPEQLASLAAMLSCPTPPRAVNWVPVVAGSVTEARAKWHQHPDMQAAVLDLYMPDTQGHETVDSGFDLLREFARRPGRKVLIHSGLLDPKLEARAKELGAERCFDKDGDPGELLAGLDEIAPLLLNWDSAHPRPEPDPQSLDAVNAAAEAKHVADRAWFLSDRTLWADRQEQVVAVFDRTVLGAGPGFRAAYEAAKQQSAAEAKSCPSPNDITFVVVPFLFDYDGVPL